MDNLTPITREEMLMNDEPMTPITREEKILAGEDLTPVTRREYFLKKYRHAGGDVMVEGLEVTANGTYTAPEGKAYSPVEVAVPLPDNAYLLKTASGSLVSFTDGSNLPMKSFVCNIDAGQDIHGYDAPWVGGAGKNKLPMTVDGIKAANTSGTWDGNSYTRNSVTYTILTDSDNNVIGISLSGTATADTALDFPSLTLASDGFLSGCPVGGSVSTYRLRFSGSSDTGSGAAVGAVTQAQVPYIWIANGVNTNGLIFYPMIRLATETDPTFAPYSNICSISGHTGVDAWVRGKNLANPATVTTLYPTGDSGTYPNQIRSSSNARSVITEVTPNTTYTISKKAGQRFRLAFTEEEPSNGVDDYGYTWNDTGTTITVTSPSNAKYMVVLFWSSNVDTDTEEDMLATLQIEIGETATTYEPYNSNSQTIQVSWQTEAGEVYGGYIDLVSGMLVVTWVIIEYDGHNTESWTMSTGGSGDTSWHQFYMPRTSAKNSLNAICNRFPTKDIAYRGTESLLVAYTDRTFRIALKDSDLLITSVEDFKTWLSTNNLQIVYELATPITYQLTPQQIKSLLGNNNAWCDTGDVDIDYFAKEVTG